jgi:hypothetical protein
MSMKVFSANEALPELTTSAYRATFKTPQGAVIPGASITSVVMTLTAQPSGAIINGRSGHETLGDNGSVTAEGVYTLVLDADDLVMVGTAVMQARRLVLQVTYTDGDIPHVVTFFVKNHAGVG